MSSGFLIFIIVSKGDKRNPKKMQLEKERLERIQREGEYSISFIFLGT